MRLLSPHQFLAETGLPERTLRHWTRHGVVPSFRSPDGVDGYTEFHRLRVRGAFALQAQGVRRLGEIAARLDRMSEVELRSLVGESDVDEGLEGSEAPEAPNAEAVPVVPSPIEPMQAGEPARNALLAEDHAMLRLGDGLLLLVRRPTDESTRALVRRIAALCGRGDVIL